MTHFKNLLTKVLDGTATEGERSEFLSLLQTGAFDDELTAEDLEKAHAIEFEDQAVSDVYDRMQLEQPGHVAKTVPFSRPRTWLAAAAIIIIAVVAGVWFIPEKNEWFNLSGTEQENDQWTTYTGKQVVDLADGSRVVLNENSELKHKHSFGKSGREVILTGEAAFDVAHDASKPFLVHTGKVTTKVLGTEFNINAYPERGQVTVTVLRGLVEVGDERRTYAKISPDEQIEVDVKSEDFVKRNTVAEDALAWQKNFFILDNVTFAEAAVQIEKRFNVKVTIRNEALKHCIVTAWYINNENLKEIVEGLGIVQQATATIKGDHVIFEGGTGCKPAH